MSRRSDRLKAAENLRCEVERFYDIGRITGIKNLPTNPGVFSLTTDRGLTYYLKVKSKDTERITFEHELLDYLNRKDMPVAPAVVTKRGSNTFKTRFGGPFALYPELPGKRLSTWKPAHLEAYGDCLARLQHAMKSFKNARRKAPSSNLVKNSTEAAGTLLDRILMPFREINLKLIRAVRSEISSTFKSDLIKKLPKQIIHRDFHPWNIKLSGGKVSGILDFEMAVYDMRLFDLCYLAGSILADDFKRAKLIAERFRVIRSKYENITPLSGREKKCIRATFLFTGLLYVHSLFRQRNKGNAVHAQTVLEWLFEERELFDENAVSGG
ncbi:MAG: phosphotransferase enzyme family protein [Planctomycetota bacterium]